MTTVDYQNYTALFSILTSYLRKPDLVIYLKATPEVLMERIARRGRASELGIGIDYITRLNQAYDDWMLRARNELEVLEINTDAVPLQGETPAFRQLVDDLKRRYPRQVEMSLSPPAAP
jgi:deoxyadenosine/deoxycytidine kinase